MKRSRIAVVATAVVVLPGVVGGFMIQRREATDAARLFAQVFARIAADAVAELHAPRFGGRVRVDLGDGERALLILDQHADAAVRVAE